MDFFYEFYCQLLEDAFFTWESGDIYMRRNETSKVLFKLKEGIDLPNKICMK